VHWPWANDLKLNYFDDAAPAIGTELVTTSVTSGGNPGATDPTPGEIAQNPHLNYVGNQRGYVRVTAATAQLTAEFVKVSSVTEKDPAKVTASVSRRFVVQDGQPGLQDA
jgi:alkaline phosphatase D